MKNRIFFQNLNGLWPRRSVSKACFYFALSFSAVFVLLGLGTQWVTLHRSQILKTAKSLLRQLPLSTEAYAKDGLREKSAVPSPYMALNNLASLPQEPLAPIPFMSDRERLGEMSAVDALEDPLSRISENFHIPEGFEPRVKFWFNIYTQHDSHTYVIHHLRYPWIVYKIINTREMVQTGKGPYWLRKQRAEKFVASEKAQIRNVLKRLSYKRSFAKLTPAEKQIYDLFQKIPGKRSYVFRSAAAQVRSQLGQRDFFLSGLRNSSKYLPYMENIFLSEGVPVELTRIPFVESSFNEEARSRVGASGIWQIMPRTGKQMMIVSDQIDERNSPLKATRAAAKLLRQYNRIIKSWPLAVTSYNHGIGNIQKAIRAARSRDLVQIIARYHQGDFKFASSNFYACFLAALHAEKYSDLVFPQVSRERLLERETLRLGSLSSIHKVQEVTGLSKEILLRYNRDLLPPKNRKLLLPQGYELHLPPGFIEKFHEQYGKQDQKAKKRA